MTDEEIRAKSLEIASRMINPIGKIPTCLILKAISPVHVLVAKAAELYIRNGDDMSGLHLSPECLEAVGKCNIASTGCTHKFQS